MKHQELPCITHITAKGSNEETTNGLDPWLLERLQEIYNIISRRPKFPVVCFGSSFRISRLGLRVQKGWFLPDLPVLDANRRLRTHSWNVIEDGAIIDLTAFQFNRRLFKPLPEGILILEPGSELYQRYIPKGPKDFLYPIRIFGVDGLRSGSG